MHIKVGAKDKGEGVLAKGSLVGKSSFFRCPPGDQKITFGVDRNMINYTSPWKQIRHCWANGENIDSLSQGHLGAPTKVIAPD